MEHCAGRGIRFSTRHRTVAIPTPEVLIMTRTTSIHGFRKEIGRSLITHLADLPPVVLHSREVTSSDASAAEIYRVGDSHFIWVSVYASQLSTSGYVAVVTRARRSTSPLCKEVALCMNPDDVGAAFAAELRRIKETV